jgi:hypothetical protein
MLFTLKLKLEVYLVWTFGGGAIPQYDDSFHQLITTNVAACVPTSKIVAELRIAAQRVAVHIPSYSTSKRTIVLQNGYNWLEIERVGKNSLAAWKSAKATKLLHMTIDRTCFVYQPTNSSACCVRLRSLTPQGLSFSLIRRH